MPSAGSAAKSWHHHNRSPEVIENMAVIDMELKNVALDEFADFQDEEKQWKQKKSIRDMTCSIPMKRAIRNRLLQNPVRTLTGWSGWKYKRKLGWNKFKISWREFTNSLELWKSSFKTVEGHFGGGVVSYFTFLKWLFFLNIYIFLLVFTFICVPMIAFPAEDYSKYVTGLSQENSTGKSNISLYCSALYIVNVSSVTQDLALDFFQGTGWMEKTLLFYGYYSNKELGIGTFSGSQYNYNMPLAYLCITLTFLLLSLALLVRHTAKGFTESVLEDSDKSFQYCNTVFGIGWDYTLEDEHNALLAHKSIFHEIMGELEEEKQLERRKNRGSCKKCGLWTVRLLINILVLALLGGSGYLIYYVQTKMQEITEAADYSTYEQFLKLLIQYSPSLSITFLNMIVPIIFKKIVQVEDYMPANEIKITLARTVMLKLASLTMLVITVYTQIECTPKDTACNVGTNSKSCPEIRCWETYVGQQLYKLVVLDFLVMLIVTLLVEFPRKLIVTKCVCGLTKLVGLQEFDITKNVLDLVYSQTLCWLGTFFSPLIPVISVLKMLITFYLKKVSLLINMKASDKPYSASKSNSYFMGVLFMSFTLVCVPVGYCISQITPSKGCGPFRIYNLMTDIVGVVIGNWPQVVRVILGYITSAACVLIVIIILLLVIYYFNALNSAHKDMIKLMKEQIILEGKDKQFLLRRINDLEGSSRKKPKSPNSSNGTMLRKRSVETPPNVPFD